jgi:protein SCO1/2
MKTCIRRGGMASIFLALSVAVCAAAQAEPPLGQVVETLPESVRDVGIDQKLNEQMPRDLVFRDETGRTVKLGDYFGRKPVILSFAYYECPMLCTLVLNGLLKALRVTSLDIGTDFEVVNISFNPKETPQLAAAKKAGYIREYGRPGADRGWHFLVGDEESVRKATQAAGFRYKYIPDLKQYAHASGIMVLTPEGRFSHYYYGIEYSARDLRLGLVEASENKIGSPVDQVLLFCFHYDPMTGKYGLAITRIMQVLGIVTAVLLAAFIAVMLRRERRANAHA